MEDVIATCPECGRKLRVFGIVRPGDKAKCRACGLSFEVPFQSLVEAHVAAGQAGPPGHVAALYCGLATNALARAFVAPYYAARHLGEAFALWARVLICLLPFSIGGMLSWSLYVLMPEQDVAYEWATRVLLVTVLVGLPTLIIFLPGQTAAHMALKLANLRARQRGTKAELERNKELNRIYRTTVRERKEAEPPKAAAAKEAAAGEAPARTLLTTATVPTYSAVAFFAGLYQAIGWLVIIAAALLVVRAFVPTVQDGVWRMGLAGLLPAGVTAVIGLAVLAVGQMLRLLIDAGQNLWRLNSTLDAVREQLGALAERKASTPVEQPAGEPR